MTEFNEQGQDYQTTGWLEQSFLEEETSTIQRKDFPEPLIPTSHCGIYSARIQGRDSAFLVNAACSTYQIHIKNTLADSLPLLLGP